MQIKKELSSRESERYIGHCQSPFWCNVLQLEVDYLVNLLPGCKDVLSIGCGPALLERALSKRGFHVVGADSNCDVLCGAPDAMDLVAVKAEALPFPPASFDAVIFVASLEFIQDYSGAIEKATELLRSQGRLIVLFLNLLSTFYQEKLKAPDSYVRHIVHRNVQPLEAAISARYNVDTAFFLGERNGVLFESREPRECMLYCVHGKKKKRSDYE